VLVGGEDDEFDAEDEDSLAALARAKEAFERLCDKRLPRRPSNDGLAPKAGDALFLTHGSKGLLLFRIGGVRADTDQYMTLYLACDDLHERLRGIPVGIIETFVSPAAKKRAADLPPSRA
jgi:hypothetical protein